MKVFDCVLLDTHTNFTARTHENLYQNIIHLHTYFNNSVKIQNSVAFDCIDETLALICDCCNFEKMYT